MPMLQYPNSNKPFKLFTDTSKHSYLGILHQEETSGKPGAEVYLIPIPYFSGPFGRTQQLWNTTQKECYTVYQSITEFTFYLVGTKCTLYCGHKVLAPFFTKGMSSPILYRLVLEVQQFNIKFECIQSKKNVVANAISRLRTLSLYQDNDNKDVLITTEDVIENIIEEVHFTDIVPRTPTYNTGKLNLDVLRKEPRQKWFCKN